MIGSPAADTVRHEAGQDGTSLLAVERLLDSLVEEILAEPAASTSDAKSKPNATRPVAGDDSAAGFLRDAAAFLRQREDADLLIDQLRDLISTGALASPPSPSGPEVPVPAPLPASGPVKP